MPLRAGAVGSGLGGDAVLFLLGAALRGQQEGDREEGRQQTRLDDQRAVETGGEVSGLGLGEEHRAEDRDADGAADRLDRRQDAGGGSDLVVVDRGTGDRCCRGTRHLLSPARLSERISLSTGATTALLNRLEAAGHITRAREHSDRRIVTLRSGGHIQERADEFFGPLAHRLDATMSHYPPQLLEQFEAFMAGLNTTMDTHLTEQGPAAPRSPHPTGGRTP